MVDFGEYFGKFGISFTGATVVSLITWFILLIVIGIVTGLIVWYTVRKLKFNKKIVIFEKIGRNFEPTAQDRAMLFKVGDAGDTVFFLRKNKKYLPTPKIQSGRGTYWFFVREDDEWINFGLTDLDEISREAGARFLDKEVRYARAGLQKLLKKRYEESSWITKYGPVMAITILVLITGIMQWLLFDKYIEILGSVASLLKEAAVVQEGTEGIIAALDNVCSGTGIRPA